MKPMYSATTKGFYFYEIHGDKVPEDAVKISSAEYKRLLSKQQDGYEVISDERGKPTLKQKEKEIEEE